MPSAQTPIEARRGYDTGYETAPIDRLLALADAPAQRVADALVQIGNGGAAGGRRTWTVRNLLDAPEETILHDLANPKIWQFRGHDWSQIDPAIGPFEPRALSRRLGCRVFFDECPQSVHAPRWGLYDRGDCVVLCEQSGSGFEDRGGDAPEAGTVLAEDGTWRVFARPEYGFDGTLADAGRIKQQIVRDCGFYVALPFAATLGSLLEELGGRGAVEAALFVDTGQDSFAWPTEPERPRKPREGTPLSPVTDKDRSRLAQIRRLLGL